MNYNVDKIKAIWKLTRLEHGIMFAIAVLIGAILVGNFGIKVIFAMMVAIFLEASAFSLNDYFDVEIDKRNKRMDRPLVAGIISKKEALVVFILFLIAGISISIFLSFLLFLISLIVAILSIFYDAWLKKIKIAGNLYIAFTMAIPFIFGAALYKITPIIYILSLIAFIVGVGREIMKDVMDFEGDVESGVKSLAFYIGKKNANRIAAFLYITACIIAIFPFLLNGTTYFMNYAYLILILMTDAILFYIAAIISFHDDVETLKRCRNISMLALFIGLIAFLIGGYKKFFF